MSAFQRYKQSKLGGKIGSSVITRSHADSMKLPDQLSEFMMGSDTRFEEICGIYLDGLTMNDLKYLTADDLICIVPPEQYKHKLLMTVFAKRYLYESGGDALKCTDSSDVVESTEDGCDCQKYC